MADLVQPPRLTGNPREDADSLNIWLHRVYDTLITGQKLLKRLERIDGLELLTQTITNPPTKAEVEAVQEAVNAIITAAKKGT